ncbi:MAG: antibiotic biosynthesis monooxygenase [Sphingomonadaceae bacterium]|nr:antibiotic biosynthesis monooxygenase [Sphingomonadaceae bacterium]
MFGMFGKLKAQPGQRDALIEYLLQASNAETEMAGCQLYVISKAVDDPDTIWIAEVWDSREAHQASLQNEAVRAIIAAARPLIAEAGGGFEVIPVGGKGLPTT